MGFFGKIKGKVLGSDDYLNDEFSEEYIEIDTGKQGKKAKITVKPFVIHDFADVKDCLDALREGYTIALINIKPLGLNLYKIS